MERERQQEQLENVYCKCGKIVAQKKRYKLYIKCRHCKRYLILSTGGSPWQVIGSNDP
ncbi:MAG: hypothetical protein ACOY3H_01910 [Bacillota bacterium]|uniref:Uncharacterized protein n=2 Tax=Carboxydocella TaxID=178898 RepID=A0A1T4MKB2_9FIRM|nr:MULTISPECIES: hypothetical protein [Carboxydocella]AVX21366.1 hypothetical protein CFE_2223 [Carboxydocella thermautotrophica]GAW28536.1 hypothetical protein ULO1_11060 [Carboxydocella sp. ULO1]SJZ67432.1 hypothetical protein SAMN02745885_00633 [Carboxydocella sporoproducens DSM 16521]